MNVVEIARMLKLGMQTPVRVTLNYARTRAFLASRLARQLDADSAELMRALTDPQLAREVGTDSLQDVYKRQPPSSAGCCFFILKTKKLPPQGRSYDLNS